MPCFSSLGYGTNVSHVSVCLKPAKYLGPRHLDDCISTGHDPTKMFETPLFTHHTCNVDKASGEVG
jgi:hypothetical protein